MCLFDFFFFQAEDGIRDLVRSRGLGDVYKRQVMRFSVPSSCTRRSWKPWLAFRLGYCSTVTSRRLLSLIHI